MKYFYLIIFGLLTTQFQAQTNSKRIDSILQIAETSNDSIRLRLLNKVGFYYIFNDPTSAKKLLESALNEAVEKKVKFSECELTNTYGIYYDVAGKSDSAKVYFEKALRLSKDYKLIELTSMVTNNLGMFHWNKGEYQDALNYFFKALELNIGNVDKTKEGIYLNNIGLIYQEMGLNDKALEYHRKALEIRIVFNVTNEIPASLNNIAINLKEKGEYEEAIKVVNKAILKAKEAAVFQLYFDGLNTLGNLYILTNRSNEAISVLEKSISGRDSLNMNRSANLASISSIINSYNKLNKPQDALVYIDKGYVFLEEFPAINNNVVGFYNNVAETYFRINKPDKGSQLLIRSSNLKDSIFSIKNAERLANLETKFKVAEKEKQLAETRANLAESKLEVKQKNYIIFGSLGLALVLGLLGYLFYNQQKLKNQQLQKENELKTALVKIETQNKLQEQRLRISRDLHDNIGSQLTFIISSLDNLIYKLKEGETAERLSKISGFTTNTIYELRDTIWAMNKNDITFEDLQTRISNFIEQAKIASDTTAFSFNISENINQTHTFTSIQGMNLYRIIQETVNNASKYAEASKISVSISEEKGKYFILIMDDGNGFDIETVELGNGISNIKKRAKELCGEVEIDSVIGKGTTVSVSVSC